MHKPAGKPSKSKMALPDKLFYKIGEVSKLSGVESYVLRYWETEFPFLKPRKNKSGQRVYIRKDLELILQIKKMLYQDRYTIEGVRKNLGEGAVKVPAFQTTPGIISKDIQNPAKTIAYIKKRLKDIVSLIS